MKCIRELKVKALTDRRGKHQRPANTADTNHNTGLRSIKKCFEDIENMPNLKDLTVMFVDTQTWEENSETAFGLILDSPFGTPNLAYMSIEVHTKTAHAKRVKRELLAMKRLAFSYWPHGTMEGTFRETKRSCIKARRLFEVMEIYRKDYTPGWIRRAKNNGPHMKRSFPRLRKYAECDDAVDI